MVSAILKYEQTFFYIERQILLMTLSRLILLNNQPNLKKDWISDSSLSGIPRPTLPTADSEPQSLCANSVVSTYQE